MYIAHILTPGSPTGHDVVEDTEALLHGTRRMQRDVRMPIQPIWVENHGVYPEKIGKIMINHQIQEAIARFHISCRACDSWNRQTPQTRCNRSDSICNKSFQIPDSTREVVVYLFPMLRVVTEADPVGRYKEGVPGLKKVYQAYRFQKAQDVPQEIKHGTWKG